MQEYFTRFQQIYWRGLLLSALAILTTFLLLQLYKRVLPSRTSFKPVAHGIKNLTFYPRGRMCNHIFQLASTIGISRTFPPNSWRVCINPELEIISAFPAVAALSRCTEAEFSGGIQPNDYNESGFGMFDWNLLYIPTNHHMLLHGFMQSWKYFRDSDDEIRRLFHFEATIAERARRLLVDAVGQHVGCYSSPCLKDVITIGVHVRRGDLLLDGMRDLGFVVPGKEYLFRAIRYLRSRLDNLSPDKRQVFVVISEDMAWCRRNIRLDDVIFVSSNDKFVDLAMLSQCQHSVITSGTYGWWSAWLANGTTVYFKNWLRPDSQLRKQCLNEDFFPPHWKGLT